MNTETFKSSEKIWILEDDEDCNFIYSQLLDVRYQTRYFSRIEDFILAIKEEPKDILPDLLLADLMLEDGNFLNFLSEYSDDKIFDLDFIVSSRIDDIDTFRFCYNEGAMDFLTKPINKNELLVKVENVLKKRREKGLQTIIPGHDKSIIIDGISIPNLTTKQIQLLALFVKNDERKIDRKGILATVWGGTSVHPKTIDVHLYNLRRKIRDFGFIIKSEGGGAWVLLKEKVL